MMMLMMMRYDNKCDDVDVDISLDSLGDDDDESYDNCDDDN